MQSTSGICAGSKLAHKGKKNIWAELSWTQKSAFRERESEDLQRKQGIKLCFVCHLHLMCNPDCPLSALPFSGMRSVTEINSILSADVWNVAAGWCYMLCGATVAFQKWPLWNVYVGADSPSSGFGQHLFSCWWCSDQLGNLTQTAVKSQMSWLGLLTTFRIIFSPFVFFKFHLNIRFFLRRYCRLFENFLHKYV